MDEMTHSEDGMSVGTVKSFSVAKGYGFLNEVAEVEEDVRFMRDDLPGQLYLRQDLKGVQLRFRLVEGNSGKLSATELSTLETPTFRSVVKSYNGAKGFGFLERPAELEGALKEGMKADVFMSSRNFVVDRMGTPEGGKLIIANTPVLFSVQNTAQGLQAHHVRFPKIDAQMVSSGVNVHAPSNFVQNQGIAAKRQRDADPQTALKKRRPIPDTTTMLVGRVMSFQKGKYGFISCADLDGEIFFGDDGTGQYQKGDVVEFFVEVDPITQKLRAAEFRKAADQSQPTDKSMGTTKLMKSGTPVQNGNNPGTKNGSPFNLVHKNLHCLNFQELVEINGIVSQLIAQAASRG